ncbi:3441_t:CDS:1, partial [Funneliformis mosseae]
TAKLLRVKYFLQNESYRTIIASVLAEEELQTRLNKQKNS